MKNPDVSVVIPTYNRQKYIAAALNSILNQKKPGCTFEIIVVDDGSTDGTEKIMEKYKGKVHYYKIKHSGLPAVVRNYGITKAKGELIAFQDSDDVWAEDKLSMQVPLFDDPTVMMSYGQAEAMDSNGKQLKQKVVDVKKLTQGQKFEDLINENVVSTLTTIIRKAALGKIGSFDESAELRAIEDYELWLRLVAVFPDSIRPIKKTLAYYRVHDQNISSTSTVVSIERILNVYNSLWDKDLLSESQYSALEEQLSIMNENWSRQQNIEGNTPAISVVMGIYKDKNYVKDAVESILEQSFKDFEFIIVDDGSQDGSYEVVNKFKDPRIRIIRQNNHGLVSVLNKGVKLARANLIARQDADDISLPKRFEKEIDLINMDERLAVVGTFFKYVDEKTLKPTGITITSMTKHLDIVRHMYFDNPIGHGTALIRRQAITEADGYTNKYGPNEDYALWRRIVDIGWKVAIIPEVMYLYRLSPGGISSSNQEAQHQFFAQLLDESWSGPVYSKPFWRIVSDNVYYKHLDSPFRDKIYHQYKSHQVRLTSEFLIHGKLKSGYNNFVGALLIYPAGALRLWKTLLWAPVKYMREPR